MKRNFKLVCDCYGFYIIFFHRLMCSWFDVYVLSLWVISVFWVQLFRSSLALGLFRTLGSCCSFAVWKRVFFCWRFYSLIAIDMVIHTYEISHDRFFSPLSLCSFHQKNTSKSHIFTPGKSDSKAIQLFSVDLVDELNMQSNIDVYNPNKSVNSSFASVILEKSLRGRERDWVRERERNPHAECFSNNQTTKHHH